MMRYLAAVSLFLLFTACNKQSYPELRQKSANERLYRKQTSLQPEFDKMLYRCTVDGKTFLKSYHLSGILFMKRMEDLSINVVFQNEMGVTYFDFSWDKNNQFRVNTIMKQMDKDALIKTLQKDFEILLVKTPNKYANGAFNFGSADTTYVRYQLQKGYVYYLLDTHNQWIGIENADDKKKVVLFQFAPTPVKTLPDSMSIRHLTANFNIQLKKMPQENVAE